MSIRGIRMVKTSSQSQDSNLQQNVHVTRLFYQIYTVADPEIYPRASAPPPGSATAVADLHTKFPARAPPNRTKFFRFYICFHRKVPVSEAGAPSNEGWRPPPTGNPGSAPVLCTFCPIFDFWISGLDCLFVLTIKLFISHRGLQLSS